MSMTSEAIVIDKPMLMDIELLKNRDCNICCDSLNLDNYIAYQLSPTSPWCLVVTMCKECLESLYESQNEKMSHFVNDLSCLNYCSKLLKHLLRGEYGIPVNLHDIVIFPSIDNLAIPNQLDPEFGRKSEVYRLSLGQKTEPRDPHLTNAPSTRDELRAVLRQVVDRVTEKLLDYDSSVIDTTEPSDDVDMHIIKEIQDNLEILTQRLSQ